MQQITARLARAFFRLLAGTPNRAIPPDIPLAAASYPLRNLK